jgi:hypothetical protein
MPTPSPPLSFRKFSEISPLADENKNTNPAPATNLNKTIDFVPV